MEVKSLYSVPGWEQFQKDTVHIEPQYFLFDVARFAHKVYAQLDAFKSKHRYVMWLDADVVIDKTISERRLKNLLNNSMCAYLGRQGSYTETGFLLFDTEHHDFETFVERYRAHYDEKLIFRHDIWVDCIAFDASIKGLDCHNLTPNGKGMKDVFSISPLAEYMHHDKGNKKNREAG